MESRTKIEKGYVLDAAAAWWFNAGRMRLLQKERQTLNAQVIQPIEGVRGKIVLWLINSDHEAFLDHDRSDELVEDKTGLTVEAGICLHCRLRFCRQHLSCACSPGEAGEEPLRKCVE